MNEEVKLTEEQRTKMKEAIRKLWNDRWATPIVKAGRAFADSLPDPEYLRTILKHNYHDSSSKVGLYDTCRTDWTWDVDARYENSLGFMFVLGGESATAQLEIFYDEDGEWNVGLSGFCYCIANTAFNMYRDYHGGLGCGVTKVENVVDLAGTKRFHEILDLKTVLEGDAPRKVVDNLVSVINECGNRLWMMARQYEYDIRHRKEELLKAFGMEDNEEIKIPYKRIVIKSEEV